MMLTTLDVVTVVLATELTTHTTTQHRQKAAAAAAVGARARGCVRAKRGEGKEATAASIVPGHASQRNKPHHGRSSSGPTTLSCTRR